MRHPKFLLAFLLLASLGLPALADTCEGWTHKTYPVSMKACSYTSGGSGYAEVTNDGKRTARLCYTIVTNNGREQEGCATLAPGASTTPSCSSCGAKNGGARHVLLRSYREAN